MRERQRERALARSDRGGAGGGGRAVSEEFGPLWTLRQRVAHVLVGLGQELLLLVGAGERVAAVVGAHVERGVHRVGEVRGLRGQRSSPQSIMFYQASKTDFSLVIIANIPKCLFYYLKLQNKLEGKKKCF